MLNAKNLGASALAVLMGVAAPFAKEKSPEAGLRKTANAGEMRGERKADGGRFLAQLEKDLNLTAAQKEQVRQIFAANYATARKDGHGKPAKARGEHSKGEHAKANKARQDFRKGGKGAFGPLHNELVNQLRAPQFNTEALNRLVSQDNPRLKDMQARRISTFAQLHAVLNPEQRSILAARMEQRHKAGEHRRHEGQTAPGQTTPLGTRGEG